MKWKIGAKFCHYIKYIYEIHVKTEWFNYDVVMVLLWCSCGVVVGGLSHFYSDISIFINILSSK